MISKLGTFLLACGSLVAQVRAIAPAASPLPPESDTAKVTKFSYIVYGDSREPKATGDQSVHAKVIEAMVARIKQDRATASPIRFVLHSGDIVFSGADVALWNNNAIPLLERLTKEAAVPLYVAAGNHDVTGATTQDASGRKDALRNTLDATAKLLPTEGSLRRLKGYPSYAIGYGNLFAICLDSNLIGDETQFAWVKAQLEGLDRKRYTHVVVFMHQTVFSSGPHGAAKVEAATQEVRTRYMPLFQQHHVEAVWSGHEHFFEHWVERYTDASGAHRMDLVVSGGGGAPNYVFSSVPETQTYMDANKVTVEQLVRPGAAVGSNPNHFLIVHVDGPKVEMEIVPVGAKYTPYNGTMRVKLQ